MAQGVGVNDDNTDPDPSAILDAKSTNKGMLVPRMTSAQRIAIATPARGLLVFDNTSTSFWFYDGTVWTELLDGTDSDNQDLSLTGNTLSLTNDGTTVNLAGYLDNTDAQTLSLAANNLSIAGGNSVSLAAYINTDNQNLSNTVVGTNRTINISGGTGTTIDVADNDNSATNEIQDLSLAGTTLTLTSDATTVDLSSFLDADNLGNHTATTNLAMSGLEIDNVRFLDVTAGVGNGLRFWQSDSYAINMGNSAEFQLGAVSDYSIKMNMSNTATRGWTWGVDGLTPIASLSTQGQMRVMGNLGIGTATVDEMLHVEGHVRAQVLEFGDYDIASPANVDGQLYRIGGQAVIEVDDWFYIRDNDENSRIRLNTDFGRIECGPGSYGGTAIIYGGNVLGNSTSDGHRLLPNANAPGTTGWGYVGQANTDWYYMYSDNFTNTSIRDAKKDITPLDENLYEYVMQDIDKIKPSFYRYKGETEEMVDGFEPKFRPNMHLGVILDESPDYLQDQAFCGIDIYAMGVFSLTGVKYNRKEIQELKNKITNASAQGKGQTQNKELWVYFNQNFQSTLNNQEAIVHITPTSMNTGYYVAEVTKEGFKVVANSDFSFNWQAQIPTLPNTSNTANLDINPTLLNGLKVSNSDKEKIKSYWDADKAKLEADYNAYLEALKISDPAAYEKTVLENQRTLDFINKYSK